MQKYRYKQFNFFFYKQKRLYVGNSPSGRQLGVQRKPFGIVSLAYDFTQMLVI